MLLLSFILFFSMAVEKLSCLPTPVSGNSVLKADSRIKRQVIADLSPSPLRATKIRFKIPAAIFKEYKSLDDFLNPINPDYDEVKLQGYYNPKLKLSDTNVEMQSDEEFESCECTRTGPQLEQELALAGVGNPIRSQVPYHLNYNRQLPHSGYITVAEHGKASPSSVVSYLKQIRQQPQMIDAEIFDIINQIKV